MLLLVGVGIIVAYVAVILGKFNEVEHKVLLCCILFDAAILMFGLYIMSYTTLHY